jgi:hypothetical protein
MLLAFGIAFRSATKPPQIDRGVPGRNADET